MVLLVSAYDPQSGVVTAYRNIVEELNPLGVRFDAYGFTGWRPDSPFRDFCDRLYGPEMTLTELLTRRERWEPLGRMGYNVLHCIDTAYEFPFSVDLWLHRARYRGGVLLNSHNSNETPLKHRPAAPHVAVAVSAASARAMSRFVDDVRVVPNGLAPEWFEPVTGDYDGPPILLWVGRSSDTEQKDLPGFLAVADRHPDYRVIVVDSDDNPAAVAGHRVEYRTRLDVAAMRQLYTVTGLSGGAFISTSRYEGMSFAFLEAGACRCPVIAPRVPGTEHLEDGTAVLYDRTEDLRGVDAALAWLPPFRDAAVEHAWHVVRDRHTREAMADGYLQAYKDAIWAATPGSRSDRVAALAWSSALKVKRKLRG